LKYETWWISGLAEMVKARQGGGFREFMGWKNWPEHCAEF